MKQADLRLKDEDEILHKNEDRIGELRPFEYNPGPLGAGQVEIDVEHCGICHSDLSMLNNEWQMTQYPFVPLNSRDPSALETVAGHFDLILSTVHIKLDWNAYISTLKPKGRLHFLGATLDPLDLNLFPILLGQRSVSGSPVGSPATIRHMLDFTALHQIKPVTEQFRFEQVNEAIARLKSGQARYRVVLSR